METNQERKGSPMIWKQKGMLPGLCIGLLLTLLWGLGRPPEAQSGPDIFASPVHAGCYLTKNDRCKIHVEPFTINLNTTPGTKLVQFKLVANRVTGGGATVIYDFRPDVSNPVPASGSTFAPSLVAKDFGATCGQSYTISLQGQDTGDLNLFNLGTTAIFTCPKGDYREYLPVTIKN
jgi:hypothetical protein